MPNVLANNPAARGTMEVPVASRFTELSDAFSSLAGRGGQLIRVNAGETGIETVPGSSYTAQGGWTLPATAPDRDLSILTLQDLNRVLATVIQDLVASGIFTTGPGGTTVTIVPQGGWTVPAGAADRNLELGTLQDNARVLATMIRDLITAGVLTT